MIQLQFLNKLLDTGDYSSILLNNIGVEFFSDFPKEYKFIKDHIDQYNCIPDKETFINIFRDFTLLTVNEPFSYLIDALYKDKNKRDLVLTFHKVRDLINEGDVNNAMQFCINAVNEVSQIRSLNTVDLLQDISRYDTYIDKCNNLEKHYVTTGFKELDMIITGWDRNEEFATIVARPNVGKSFILLKAAAAAVEKGLRVGLYSGEMSEDKVGYRLDTLISHISNGSMIHGNINIQNEYKQYIDELPNKFTGCLKVLTPAMLNGLASVTALRAFIEKENLDILFVDQFSLLADDKKAKSPTEQVANISKDLKNLQVMKKIPIIAVSQQNRSSTDDGISVSHIAQSDRIGQDSTIVIFLEQKDDSLIMELIKSRDSVNGKKLRYAVDFNRGIFEYIPEEGNAIDGLGTEELKAEFDGLDEF